MAGRPPKAPHLIKHGTSGGISWHYRSGVPTCDKCKKFASDSGKARRKEMKRRRQRLMVIIARGISDKRCRPRLSNDEKNAIIDVVRKFATEEELKDLGL